MWKRLAVVLVGLTGAFSSASAQDFRIEEVSAARDWNVAQLKPGTIAFSDDVANADARLTRFEDWARVRPVQKKFLSLFADYSEPTVRKPSAGKTSDSPPVDRKTIDGDAAGKGQSLEKLYMYVAQARFVVDRLPGTIEPSRYVKLQFLERIDPAIKHTEIAAGEVLPLDDERGAGNENPERKWCTGRPTLICIQSSYRLEGKIPLGIMLANKLRESAKKISDHIDFQSEFSQPSLSEVDQAGLRELTGLDTPIVGVLDQSIFYVNQIMKFGKFFAVFQNHPTDPGKTAVSAFMALAIDASVLEKKREFESVPVLRNLVPAQVLMGRSSFNSGNSISAGLPKYARNEIKTIAGVLAHEPTAK